MTTASLWLARLSTIASSVGSLNSAKSEVLLEGAVLELLWHPVLDMLVQFAAEHATLRTLLLAYNLPCCLELIGSNATGVQGHLGSVNGPIDDVEVGGGETEAAGVDLVKIAEDF